MLPSEIVFLLCSCFTKKLNLFHFNFRHWCSSILLLFRFDTNLNEWEDAWIARDLDISTSAWNTVSMDYPSDDNPTPTPSSPPTSPPPTKNPTNAPVLSPITPNPTSAPTESRTKTPTLSPTKACSRKRQPCQKHKDCCPKKNGRRRKCHRKRKVCR